MQHLLTTNEAISLGRPIGKIEEAKLLAFITECEQMNVKPAIGEKLFNNVLATPETEPYKTLLEGGVYEDSLGEQFSFMGLKVTMAYFVNAQNLMSGDIQSTRFGNVLKNGDYSTGISSKERSDAYNNTLEVANHYLNECVKYCRAKKLLGTAKGKSIATGGCTIRKIG